MVKTEISSTVDPTEAFPVEALPGEQTTLGGHNSCGQTDGAVKTEVGLSFPSKLATPGGELKTGAISLEQARPNVCRTACCRAVAISRHLW